LLEENKNVFKYQEYTGAGKMNSFPAIGTSRALSLNLSIPYRALQILQALKIVYPFFYPALSTDPTASAALQHLTRLNLSTSERLRIARHVITHVVKGFQHRAFKCVIDFIVQLASMGAGRSP
tara:strand:- start:59 stop:427 length:369 start_codon:yes stop_codon:yes gene_type:complete